MKKIAICIPHNYLTFNKQFTLSLIAILHAFDLWCAKNQKEYEWDILVQNSGSIDWMRNSLADSALHLGFDYLLWLDTDMIFPTRTIISMVEHFEKSDTLEAVTGLYTWKRPPFLPHVYYKFNPLTEKFKVAGGFPIDKPFVVEGAGFGVLMMKIDVFFRLQKPYFLIKIKDNQIDYGEDLYFCKNARMKMICDPSISCKHLVEVGYDIQSFVSYNNIKVENGELATTKEQLNEIEKEHLT